MYLRRLAAKLLMENISVLNNEVATESAISEVLFGGSTHFDLSVLVKQFNDAGGNISDKASSWLGDEMNQPISADEVMEALGQAKIQALAKKLGIAEMRLSKGLAAMLPQLIDTASRDGNLFYNNTNSAPKRSGNRLFEAVSSLLR